MTTESQLYRRIRPWLTPYGMVVRLENAVGSGMPDVLLAANGQIVLIELKVIDGFCIHLQKTQFAFAASMSPHIRPRGYWFFCFKQGVVYCYTWQNMRDAVPTANAELTLNISGLEPNFVLKSSEDVKHWLAHIAMT